MLEHYDNTFYKVDLLIPYIKFLNLSEIDLNLFPPIILNKNK